MIRKTYKKLLKIVGRTNITREEEDLLCYSYDSTAQIFMPDVVIFPRDTLDVSKILKLAQDEKFYVIPRGSGSGMTGGSLPVKGGVVMVMTHFNKIIKIDVDNFIVDVEPGVITANLHKAVEEQGLFYPPDPASSAICSIGGNIAECAGGPRAVKYGVTRDYVLGLEVVLPGGKIIKTGVQTAKGVVGYDLTRLIVGSEGTLAVITKITLRLITLPLKIGTMIAIFPTMETSAKTVSEIVKTATLPRTVEYMDNAAIQCAEKSVPTGLPTDAGALLIIEVDGNNKDEINKQMIKLKEICLRMGAKHVKIAKNKEERNNLWKARKALSPALFIYAPNKINEDIVVPRNKIPLMVKKISELKKKSGLMMVSFGHAGDGNIHCNIMFNKADEKELEIAEATVEELFDYTLELGGTISGEHGIGITKQKYISKEIDPYQMEVMKGIKKVFDPKGILNPDKIFGGDVKSMLQ